METKLLIEQHIHGAFGTDFNKANAKEIVSTSKKLLEYGIGGFFPTLVTDNIENICRQIKEIKSASQMCDESCSEILGIHLEGIFLNPLKKGIHNSDLFLPLTVDNYKKIEDDFIKIVTLAPELDINLINYLQEKNVKIQAGHCIGEQLNKCNGVTHLFNAMKPINHRDNSTSLSALTNDNIYTEIIADGIHLNDQIIDLILRSKPKDKIILISDALPITYSNIHQTEFAGETIYYDGEKATSANGTIAGSTTLIPQIIKLLAEKGNFRTEFIDNIYQYHNIDIDGKIIWDNEYNIVSITKNNKRIK